MNIKAADPLKFVGRRYRTIKTGKVKVLKSIDLNGRFFGNVDYLTSEHYGRIGLKEGPFSLKKGEVIEYLQDRAEGNCFIRKNEEVIDVDWCAWMPGASGNDGKYQLLSAPVTEMWGQVENNEKRGWLLINDESVQ